MITNFQASDALRKKAHALIPGGSHTYAKGDDQYPQLSPGFLARGLGSHVWDVDGNEFIEFGQGNRSVGLGHCHPAVTEAARKALALGVNFVRPHAIEVEAAEQFLAMIPNAEMVKFSKDGSDATSGAVKLARAYTGRDLIAICGDHPFFSVDDWFIGATAMDGGIPQATKDLTVKFRYNDIASVEALFAHYPGRIAGIILEAEKTDAPKDGFLQKLHALARKEGALFILDEMITGFRWSNGGAQALHGLDPDLSTWGKAMSNGFSVSALAGKREFMRLGGLDHTDKPRVFLLSTTHGAETHGLAAAIATMKVYQNEPVIAENNRKGERLKRELTDVAARHGVSERVRILGPDCCLLFTSGDRDGKPSQGMRTLLLQELIKRGVLAPSLVISYAHSEEDISKAIDAFDGALAIYRRALDDGYEKYLVGPPSQIVYRAFNVAR